LLNVRAFLLLICVMLASQSAWAQGPAEPVKPEPAKQDTVSPEPKVPEQPAVIQTPAAQSPVVQPAVDQEKLDQAKLEQKKFDAAYAAGTGLYQKKNFDGAIKQFELAAKSPAEDGSAGTMLGYCYYAKKDYARAIKEYKFVSDHAKLISKKNAAQRLASQLDSYMRGVCPGKCLKPSNPGWKRKAVAGHDPNLSWISFPYNDANESGESSWSSLHMGEVIEYVNNRPVNKGRCPICGGTGKVKLP